MATNHIDNIDPRPKRRKSKDNPYTIHSVGIGTDHARYFVSFRDGQGVEHHEEISRELFDAFNTFELEDLSFLNEVDNHYEHSELTEESLYGRVLHQQAGLEESAFQKLDYANLHEVLASLPDIQRRRVYLYFFEGYTYEKIASQEGCTKMAVKFSIDIALKKMKEKF